jgi:pimeloyl-ACP methyl ester carboxylesterase
VHPSVPVNSVSDLIALAKTKPGAVTFGTAGVGTALHIAGLELENLAGIKLTAVHYRGAAPALTDVIAGHVNAVIMGPSVALARPDRIASMALYEPSAFHLLRQMGKPGAEAHAEIAGVARRIGQGVVTGDYRGAVAAFVDYWNGPGAWKAMRPSVQNALIRWAPKGPLDFQALIEDPTPASAYRALEFPVLILRGEHAPMPTRVIAEGLAELLPNSRLMIVECAGHMGPLTHAPEVSHLIVQHIAAGRLKNALKSY